MGLSTGAIFIMFAVSAAGTLVPVISQKIPKMQHNSIFMEAIRAFSFGVVLATGLIHMVSEGIENLSDEALGPIVEEYGCLGLAIVLITMIVLQFIEAESVIFFAGGGSMLHGHGHSHGHGDSNTNDSDGSTPESPSSQAEKKTAAHNANIRRKVATIIFEAGVIFHSVIVGLDLGVTTGPKFNTLLTALSFHQFFEGVAIGSAADTTTKSKTKLFMINFAFAITTPIGQAIGIGVRSTYDSESTTALWVQGVFDCVAGGILLYTGLVELLTYNMTTNQKFLSRSTLQRYALYACLWSGAGLMALIGKWS
ncbi:hypothetical protein PF008_g6114 [Phytophthora fragariae]|uniref:Zinc transporter 5 n=1 Tax=Phytophthora fragariae TaxID=53985 RepID=A0A6G0S6E2_9STRA|nr:hypothetical protein PF008_g6114 [Phytophthora fragariae]